MQAVLSCPVTAFAAGHTRTVAASVMIAGTSTFFTAAATAHDKPVVVVAPSLLRRRRLVAVLGGQDALQVMVRPLLTLTCLPSRTADITELVSASTTMLCQ